MRSYLSQAHQRDYQGNVILAHSAKHPKHRLRSKIAVGALVLIVAITGSLLGMMTLHNQHLKQQIQTMQTQSASREPTRVVNEVPISQQQYETDPMPSLPSN